MKPLKILHVMNNFPRHAERIGWGEKVEDHFNPDSAFREVHILSMYDDYDYGKEKFKSLIVHPLKPRSKFLKSLGKLGNLCYLHRAIRLADQIIKENEIDLVIHAYGIPSNQGLIAVKAAKKNKVPSIITLHNDYDLLYKIEKPFFNSTGIPNFLMRYLIRNASGIRCVNKFIIDYAVKRGAKKERVRYVPLKEDIEKLGKSPEPGEIEKVKREFNLEDKLKKETVLLLTVAKFYKQKNLKNMILGVKKALQEYPTLLYLIAGSGPLEKELKRVIRRLELEEKVLLLGYVPQKKLLALYHLSDIFLFPTFFEGRPRAVFEALLAKLPIICSNYGAVTEMIKNEEDGLWVNPNSSDDIAKAILLLARDRELREKLSKHETFDKEHFSIPRVNKEEVKFYLDTLRG